MSKLLWEIHNLKYISVDDIKDIARKELMTDIWIEFESGSICIGFVYGYDGEQYYCLGDRCWNPIYEKTREGFEKYVEDESYHYHEPCLLKIK